MSKIFETLSSHIERIERFQKQFKDKDIILSTDFEPEIMLDNGIPKTPIVWPLYQYNMFYLTTVTPKTTVDKHSHNEDIFRFVTKGSLILNKTIKIDEQSWFIVRKNVPYEVYTETGYSVIAGYGVSCSESVGKVIMGE